LNANEESLRNEVEKLIRTLNFFSPEAKEVPPNLRAFKYLFTKATLLAPPKIDGIARTEIQARLDQAERSRGLWDPDRSRIPDAVVMAKRQFAGETFNIALWRVLIGEVEIPRQLFAEAASLLESAAFLNPPSLPTFSLAIDAAILSGERNLARRIARRWNEVSWPDRYVHGGEHLVFAMARLIMNERDAVRSDMEAALAAGFDELELELLRCVAEEDRSHVQKALQETLKKHHSRAIRKQSQIWNSLNSFISLQATALLLLARWLNFEVNREVAGRKAVLKNLLIVGLQEYQSRRINTGTTFDLEVDYILEKLFS